VTSLKVDHHIQIKRSDKSDTIFANSSLHWVMSFIKTPTDKTFGKISFIQKLFIWINHCNDYFFIYRNSPRLQMISGVNFINILHTNFSYKHCFGSFFYVHITREKLLKQRSYEKFVRKMLMKLTTVYKKQQKRHINSQNNECVV